jgi:hypothetical protein
MADRHPLASLFEEIIHQLKEQNTLMSTIAEDLSALTSAVEAVTTSDSTKNAEIADLTAKLAAAEASLAGVDPNAAAELTAAQATIVELTAKLNALVPPVPVPSIAYFTFTGDPATVDAAQWATASVHGSNGEVLYTHMTTDPFDTTVWVAYTGVAA